MRLEGSTCLVTGASRGIGRAIAADLADRGARVLAGARPGSKEPPPQTTRVTMDLGSRESIESSCDALADELGRIDVLVNNAGSFAGGQLETQDVASMYDVFQVNLVGLAHLTRRVLPGMLERGSGKLVNHSSIVGYLHFPGVTTYAASKAGVSAFTDCLRRELKGSGVTTMEIVTGGVDTDMLDRAAESFEGQTESGGWQWMDPADWAHQIVDGIEQDKRVVGPPGRARVGKALSSGPAFLVDALAGKGFERS
jgi:short-subunit dehydrogenase